MSEEPPFDSHVRHEIYFLSKACRQVLWSIQSPTQDLPAATFPVVKELGHEADNSPQCSMPVTHKQNYTSATPSCLHDVQREGFTLPSL